MNMLWNLVMFVSCVAWILLWLIIGWRAIRAHESLAQSHSRVAEELRKLVAIQTPGSVAPLQAAKLAGLDPKSLPKFKE